MNCDTAPSAKTPESSRALHHICLSTATRKGLPVSWWRPPRRPRRARMPLQDAKHRQCHSRCDCTASRYGAAAATGRMWRASRARASQQAVATLKPASRRPPRPSEHAGCVRGTTRGNDEGSRKGQRASLPFRCKVHRKVAARALFCEELHALVVRGVAFEQPAMQKVR